MNDSTIPSIIINPETQIDVAIASTDALSANQGYTYDQSGFTYNQSGVEYGGVYQLNQDVIPVVSFALNEPIRASAEITDSGLSNQGYTYDQATFTYNQAGIQYGGLYNINQDLSPVFSNDTATLTIPFNNGIVDLGTPKSSPSGNNNIGPGWFMYINLQ